MEDREERSTHRVEAVRGDEWGLGLYEWWRVGEGPGVETY